MRATELEAEQWARLDAEIRNAMQGVGIAQRDETIARQQFEVELAQLKANHRVMLQRLQGDKERLLAEAGSIQPRYNALTQKIADRFGLDPKQMSIDPETCVVRDLRDEATGAS